MKSVERTVEGGREISSLSVVRFTDFVVNASLPNDESLGYCQPSAGADWTRDTFLCRALSRYSSRPATQF
jgi:hypothetical protein